MDATILKTVGTQLIMALMAGSVTLFVECERANLQGLIDLEASLGKFVPFLLSLWVSLALTRWWSLRTKALGEVFDASSNLCMIVSGVLPDTDKYHGLREQVLKYGMASVLLMVQAAREQSKLELCVEKGFLTAAEIEIIRPFGLYQRAMMMWPWALKLVFHGFEECQLPLNIFNECIIQGLKARDGIDEIDTHLNTQVPLAYVHLICLLTSLAVICNTVRCGMLACISAKEWYKGNGSYSEHAWSISTETLYFLLVQITYQGLLGISYLLHDPFGDDVLDFPIQSLTDFTMLTCRALFKARYCPAEDRLFPHAERVKEQQRTPKTRGRRTRSDTSDSGLDASADDSVLPLRLSLDKDRRVSFEESQPPKGVEKTSSLTSNMSSQLSRADEDAPENIGDAEESSAGIEHDHPFLKSAVQRACSELSELIKSVDSKLPCLDEYTKIQKSLEERKVSRLTRQRELMYSNVAVQPIQIS
jgi:hypothetical protein